MVLNTVVKRKISYAKKKHPMHRFLKTIYPAMKKITCVGMRTGFFEYMWSNHRNVLLKNPYLSIEYKRDDNYTIDTCLYGVAHNIENNSYYDDIEASWFDFYIELPVFIIYDCAHNRFEFLKDNVVCPNLFTISCISHSLIVELKNEGLIRNRYIVYN